MAKYIKNDINFHGARSKTRVVENSSKNKKTGDDCWSSTSNRSMNNNADHGWGEVPSDGAIHHNSWESDRLVYGKSERNRKFRSGSDNSSFRVPIQSVPNWEEADTEFPSLGSRREAPVDNVWEKRKQKFKEKAAIVPSNETEEEMMIRKALELSMKESRMEEERRRHLEEEYQLQMELLEANPDMFNEFRADQNEFPSFDQYPENRQEDFSTDGVIDCDQGAWGYSSKKTAKEKNKTEYQKKANEEFPQQKPNSTQPTINSTTQSKNKISQAVEMFGGWGTPMPFSQKKAPNQNAVAAKPAGKPSQWDTVDTEFVPLQPSKKTVVEETPTIKPTPPPSLEVKFENTSSWVESVNAKSSFESIEAVTTEATNNLGTLDAVELNLKDAEPAYSIDQKEKEFESQAKRKKVKPKLARRFKEKENGIVPTQNSTEATVPKGVDNTAIKTNDLAPEETETKTSAQNADLAWKDFGAQEDRSKIRVNQSLDESCDRNNSGHANQQNNSSEFKSTPQENMSKPQENETGAKSEDKLLKTQFPEAQNSLECDYAFLLNKIEVPKTIAQSEDLSLMPPVAKDSSITNDLPDIYQTTFNIDNFLADASLSNVSTIPEPVPFHIEPPSAAEPNQTSTMVPDENPWNKPNSNDAPRTFGGYPTNPQSFNLPSDSSLTNPNDAPPLPTFDQFQHNPGANNMPAPQNGETEQPRIPGPEFANPGFFMQPRPVLAPMMNPALMMGMNPLLMQQMMMPYFLQQLTQMDMYYKTMGMAGMPLFPQPMPVPAFNAQNFQVPNPGTMQEPPHNISIHPLEEANPILAPVQRPDNQPRAEPNLPTTEQPSTPSFWFEDFMSSDSVIPPPIPNPTAASANPDVLQNSFSAMSLQGTETRAPNTTTQEPSKVLLEQPPVVPSQSPVATGWGELDVDSKSSHSSGWNDSVEGWGDSDSTTKAMRNSSRYVSENRANCRQPTSRPHLRRPKQ